jgi:hypothetical protein
MERLTQPRRIGPRRIACCSICRRTGHNMRTCHILNREIRMREFELECSIKCQNMEIYEFNDWIRETYNANVELLRDYAAAKCSIQSSDNTQVYIDAITSYIYETYVYQYTSNMVSGDDEYVSLEEAMIGVLSEMNRPIETTQLSSQDMEASLTNDIISGEYFETLLQNIQLRRYGQLIQSAYQETSLISRYGIENLLEEKEEKKEKEYKIECSICFDEYNTENCVKFGCKHEFCKDCAKNLLLAKPYCAYCRSPVTKMISRKQEIHKELEELVV